MAKAQNNLGNDLDSLDLDGGLDGLNLEDDALFADLDNEFKMDDLAGGGDGLELDLGEGESTGGAGGDALDDLMGSGDSGSDSLDDLMGSGDAGGDSLDDLMAGGGGEGDGLELDLGGGEGEPNMDDLVEIGMGEDPAGGALDDLDTLPEETPGGSAEAFGAESLDLGGMDEELGPMDALTDEAIESAGGADLSLDDLDLGESEADSIDLGPLMGEEEPGAGSLDLGALEPESVEPALDEDSLDLSTVPKRGAAGAGEDEVLDLDEVPMAPEATGEALDFSETDTDGSLNLPEGGDELELPELVDMAEPAQSAEAEKEVRLEGFEALDEEPGLPGEGDSTIQFDTLDELSEEPAAPTKSGEFFAVPDVNLDDVSLEDLVSGSAAAAAAAQPKPAAPPRQTKAPGQAKAAEEDVLELSSAQAVSAPPALKSPLGLERELLLSVPRKVNVEMGSVSLSGSEIMELSYGSIVQLEQTVGEPVELVLEGRIIARGEVVVINGRALGVRILQLQK